MPGSGGSKSKASGPETPAPHGLERLDVELAGVDYIVLSYPSPPHGVLLNLSQSESDVARAVATGLTNEEIAKGRGRSLFTVQNQLARIYKKLEISSRAELVALLAQLETSHA